MSSFTESATLVVIDKSSAAIKKINAELAKLAKTANSLKKTGVSTNAINKALTGLEKTGGKAAKGVTQVADATKKLAAVKLDNTTKGLNQVADATKKLSTANKAAKGTAATLAAQVGKKTEGDKAATAASKDATKESEKKTAAQKAGAQASIVANKVTAKETKSQKTQAKVLQQVAEQVSANTKALNTEAKAKTTNADATKKQVAEQGRLTKAENKHAEQVSRAQRLELGDAEKLLKARNNLRVADERLRDWKKATPETRAANEALRARRLAELDALRPGPRRTSVPSVSGRGGGGGGEETPGERRRGGRGERGGGLFGAAGSIAQFAAAMAGLTLAHALGKAIVEGTKQIGIGETSLKLKQLDTVFENMAAMGYHGFDIPPGGAENRALRLVKELGDEKARMQGGAFLNRGQRTEIYSEALGTTSLNLEGAKNVTAQLEELVRTGVALGQSQDKATDKAYAYAKAADMMTRMTYTNATMVKGVLQEAGSYREGGATPEEIRKARARGIEPPDLGSKNFFDYMQKLQPTIGKEMTGQSTQMIAKYLGATRYGVNNRAFGATMILGEEMGTRAAVGYRQAVKQLSGIEQTKDRKALLADMGLINFTRGGTKKKPTLTLGAPIDDALMKQNLPEWIAKHIAEGQGGERYSDTDPDEKKRGRLIDPNSPLARFEKKLNRAFNLDFPEDVQELGRHLVGNSNALDTLTSYMYNWKEIKRKLDEVDARDPDAVRAATKDSIPLATEMLKNQFTGLMGETVKAFAPVLVPAMGSMSEGMRQLGETIGKAATGTPEEKAKARAQLTEGALTAAIVGVPAAGLAKIAATVLSPVAETIGTVSALTQLQDPKTAPTAAAALGLIGAANALKGAAAALMVSAGKPGLEMLNSVPALKGLVTGISAIQMMNAANFYSPEENNARRDLIYAQQNHAAAQQAMADFKNSKYEPALQREIDLIYKGMKKGSVVELLATRQERLQEALDKYTEVMNTAAKKVEAFTPQGPDWSPLDKPKPEVTPEKPVIEAKTLNVDELLPGRTTPSSWSHVPIPKENIPKGNKPIIIPIPKEREWPWDDYAPRERKYTGKGRNRREIPPLPMPRPFVVPAEKEAERDKEHTGKAPGFLTPTDLKQIPGQLAPLAEFNTTSAAVATTFKEFATQLVGVPAAFAGMQDFPERFASTFTTGADAIKNAGASAVSVMQAGAGSIGSAIGAAFVASAQGVTANINVTTNVTGGTASKVNTGDLSTTGG